MLLELDWAEPCRAIELRFAAESGVLTFRTRVACGGCFGNIAHGVVKVLRTPDAACGKRCVKQKRIAKSLRTAFTNDLHSTFRLRQDAMANQQCVGHSQALARAARALHWRIHISGHVRLRTHFEHSDFLHEPAADPHAATLAPAPLAATFQNRGASLVSFAREWIAWPMA